MADFSVEIDGIEELQRALNATAEEMNLQLDKVIELVADALELDADTESPEDKDAN